MFQHLLHVLALRLILKVQKKVLSFILKITNFTRWAYLLQLIVWLWLFVKHGKSNHQVSYIIRISLRLHITKLHFLVNNYPVFIWYWEVRLQKNKEFWVNHHVSYTHIFRNSLVTQNELYINSWKHIALWLFPRVNHSLFSGYRVDFILHWLRGQNKMCDQIPQSKENFDFNSKNIR